MGVDLRNGNTYMTPLRRPYSQPGNQDFSEQCTRHNNTDEFPPPKMRFSNTSWYFADGFPSRQRGTRRTDQPVLLLLRKILVHSAECFLSMKMQSLDKLVLTRGVWFAKPRKSCIHPPLYPFKSPTPRLFPAYLSVLRPTRMSPLSLVPSTSQKRFSAAAVKIHY